jgi:tetratricopeptide (TPR) repeat protein
MAEDYPELGPASPWPDFDKVRFCFDGVRSAECFVAIITNRHGTEVRLDDDGSVPSSFFEAELFQAALLRKPAFVFLLNGHEPGQRMANLLKLLSPFFPGMSLSPASEDEILRKVEGLISHYQRARWRRRPLLPARTGEALLTLFKDRHSPYDVRSTPPSLRFLNGWSDPSVPRPDLKLVEAVLDRAANEQDHHGRITLLWFAIRALMGAPFEVETSTELLSLWDRAFETWNSTGAWYGMHGHIAMGCLATLGSLADVRQRLSYSTGALASAYYSAARLASSSRELLALSLKHVEAALVGTSDVSGPLAIRGSIYREMGLKEASIRDYQQVVDLRREGDNASFGEALSELGYAHVLFGNPKQGVALMEQGLDRLNQAPASGFHVRAIRKLAIGYARCWKFSSALDRAVEAHDMAQRLGALDQIRTVERLAARIDVMRRWRQ